MALTRSTKKKMTATIQKECSGKSKDGAIMSVAERPCKSQGTDEEETSTSEGCSDPRFNDSARSEESSHEEGEEAAYASEVDPADEEGIKGKKAKKRFKGNNGNAVTYPGQSGDRRRASVVNASIAANLSELNPNFTPSQRKAIVEIGFGALLELNIPEIPGGMHQWLIKNFEPRSRNVCVGGRPVYTLTWADVHDVFLLPHGSLYPVEGYTSEVRAIMDRWCNTYIRFPHGKRTKLGAFKAAMMSETDGGPDFKRMYVLYALAVFLSPVSNKTMYYQPLASLIQVDDIVKYDWCTYVLEKTCQAVGRYTREWKKQKFFSGCMLFLMLTYMHRVPWQGIPEPRERPLCKWWTLERLKWRISEELACGGFGKSLFDKHSYPISKDESEGTKTDDMTKISFRLPAGTYNDKQLRQLLPNEYQRSIAMLVRDLRVVAGDRFEAILNGNGRSGGIMQGYSKATIPHLIHYVHQLIDWLQAIKIRLEESQMTLLGICREDVNEIGEPQRSAQYVCSRGERMECTDRAIGSQRVDSQHTGHNHGDMGDVSVREHVGRSSKIGENVDISKNLVPELLRESHHEHNHPRPEVGQAPAERRRSDEVRDPKEGACMEVLTPEPVNSNHFQETLTGVRSSASAEADVPKESMVTNVRIRPPCSRLVNELERAGVHLPRETRDIVDLCISGYDRKLVPFSDGVSSLDIIMMHSFEKGERLKPQIISCWGRILNAEVTEGVEKSKIYLDVLQLPDEEHEDRTLPMKWSEWMRQWKLDVSHAEMIFLPVMLGKNIFLLVVNLCTKQFLYFDCWKGRKTATKLIKAANELKFSLTRWLTVHGLEMGLDVRTFDLVTVDGDWRISKMTRDDGVFVMHLMETLGARHNSVQNFPFAKVEYRSFLRASLCSRIILSSYNLNKDLVLAAARTFFENK